MKRLKEKDNIFFFWPVLQCCGSRSEFVSGDNNNNNKKKNDMPRFSPSLFLIRQMYI